MLEKIGLEMLVAVVIALTLAAALTLVVRRFALSRGVIDVPNNRSSHSIPTPRGGGLAIVLATNVVYVCLTFAGLLRTDLLAALGGGGIAIALIGFLDDRKHVPARIRLIVHTAAAVWALVCLGGGAPLQWGDRIVDPGLLGYLVGIPAIIWAVNLFNFMDGIDGIAASEATFMAWAAAALGVVAGASESNVVACLVLGAACCGFLLWNWPPARIFMGDVGSGYLGYSIAVLALAFWHEYPVAPYVWLILGSVFFADATITLLRRLARGEPVHLAHRSHAYQWLARRWASHRSVTVAAVIVNVAWLLPWATLTMRYTRYSGWFTVVALVPVVIAVVALRAGRAETAHKP